MATMEEIMAQWGQGEGGAPAIQPQTQSRTDQMNPLAGAAQSALWAAGPGMIGVEPEGRLGRFQAENPVLSMASQFAGMAAPYAGLFRLSQTVKPWANLVSRAAPAEKLARSPFMGGAAREVARWAPAEAGLLAGGALLGDPVADMVGGEYKGVWEQGRNAALAVGLGGAFGGALSKLGSAGRASFQRRGVTPGADLGALPQVQIRQVLRELEQGNVAAEFTELAQGGINRLKRRVLNEDPERGFFRPAERGEKEADAWSFLQDPGKQKGRAWRVQKLTSLRGDEAAANLLDGLPSNWEAFARFPRMLAPRQAKSASKRQKNIETLDKEIKTLFKGEGSSPDIRFEAFPQDGIFAVAKRTEDGRWMTFQTDSPGVFLPETARWSNVIKQESIKNFDAIDPAIDLSQVPSEILQWGRQMLTDLPMRDFRGLKNEPQGLGKAFRVLGTESRVQNTTEGLRRFGVFSRAYLAPADLQFTHNPVAHRIRRISKEMIDRAEKLTQDAILGQPTTAGRNLLRETAFGPQFADPGSIASKVKNLSQNEDDWRALLQTIHSGEGIESGIANYGLSDEGAALLRQIQGVDTGLAQSIIGAQRAVGVPEKEIFRPKEAHFMLSRTWKGNWRTPVYNDKHKLVYVAGGENRAESLALARKVADERGWRSPADDTAVTTDMWGDLEMARKVAVNTLDYRQAMRSGAKFVTGRQPGTFAKREGVEGFVVNYSPEEFLRSLVSHSRRYRNYEAELSTQALFKGDMDRLAFDDKETAVQLKKRLDQMFGHEGPVSQAVNKAFDTVLAPFMGNNSASKIMGALNSGMYRYSLGFMNMGYGVATLLTFAQTAFPMMTMVNTLAMQAPQRLNKYSSYRPVFSEGGADVMQFTDPMKIAWSAVREIRDADPILAGNMRRAAAEGTTDPRFLDEFVGQNALNKQKFNEVLKSDEPVMGFLRVLADTVPASTERFSRGHSFAMGHIFYRDIMGVKDPEILFKLSKEFTDKTQYLYGTGDRPQIITGPVGSSFGLFKNWVMNYIGWMASYAGEAFMYNNWKPLMMMMGGTGAIGGVGALPMVGAYDALSKMLGGESAMSQIYEGFGGTANRESLTGGIADMIYYGLPMGLGISVQSTVQAPFHDPTEDAARFFQIATWDQAGKIGRAVGTSMDAMNRRGVNFLSDPLVRQQLSQAFVPKSIYRSMSMAMDDKVVSQNTNNPLIMNMSPSERVLHGLSLNPRWVSTRFAFAREAWNDAESYKKRVQGLGRDMAEAMTNRDRKRMKALLYAAMADNVPIDSVMKSAEARRSRSEEDIITSQFDDEAKARMRRLNLL